MLQKARNLRKNQTDAEKLIWRYLKNRQLNEYKFRRQCPIGSYLVDFVGKSENLIVEIDGGQHVEMRSQDEVLRETEGVLERIFEELEKE